MARARSLECDIMFFVFCILFHCVCCILYSQCIIFYFLVCVLFCSILCSTLFSTCSVFCAIYFVFCDLFYMTSTENTLGQQIGWISRLRKQHVIEDCDMHWMHCLSHVVHQATNFDGQVAIWTTGSLQRKLAVCRLGLHPAASVWRHYVTAIALHKSCAKFVWVLG